MKRILGILIAAALFATPAVLAQTNSMLGLRHHGTNFVAASGNYPGMTNVVTASGTLSVETLTEIESPTTHKTFLVSGGTNGTSGKQMTVYFVRAADGTRVTSFGAQVAATSPANLSGYLGQPVTIVGLGRVLQGKNGKLIQIAKITSITKNASAPPAAATQ